MSINYKEIIWKMRDIQDCYIGKASAVYNISDNTGSVVSGIRYSYLMWGNVSHGLFKVALYIYIKFQEVQRVICII